MNASKLHNLPQQIKALTSFVLWEEVSNNKGAPGKRPFDPQFRGRGNDDPTLHLSLDQASRMLKAYPNKKLGIGLYQPAGGVPLNADGHNGYLHIVDLDGFVGPDAEEGKIRLLDLGWDIVKLCSGSYLELSPSGIGAKILLVSDLKPATKTVFKLPPNEWAAAQPEVRKYNDGHAVEHFTEKFWNALTGDVWSENYKELRFVPSEKLQEVFERLNSLDPKRPKSVVNVEPSTTVQPATRRLTEASLIQVLTLIDNQTEPIWSDVANCLARTYGSSGEDYFLRYSEGFYNGKPYPGFDEEAVRARYQRALGDLVKRPTGFGNKRLC
jgi:hypothetical protein